MIFRGENAGRVYVNNDRPRPSVDGGRLFLALLANFVLFSMDRRPCQKMQQRPLRLSFRIKAIGMRGKRIGDLTYQPELEKWSIKSVVLCVVWLEDEIHVL